MRFEVPPFITLVFSPEGLMEYIDAGNAKMFPKMLRSASYGENGIILTFGDEKGSFFSFSSPNARWNMIEGYRLGPDALFQRLRRYGVDFSYSEDDITATVSFMTERGCCEVFYDCFSTEAYVISAIRYEGDATGMIRVHAFAESFCSVDGDEVSLPFLFESMEQASRDWRCRPARIGKRT